MNKSALALALLFAGGAFAAAFAQNAPVPGPPQQHVKIGFVEVEGDPRYEPIRAYERIILKTREHPFAGAEVGIDEAAPLKRVLNTDFTLDRIVAKSPAEVAPAVAAAADAGTHFFLIDVPAEAYKPLTEAVQGKDVLLFNVSEPDDTLRRNLCAASFVHVYPSRAQLMDGLVQFVVSRKWTNLLVLEGPTPGDATRAAAFAHSAQKFGARVVADQHFKPGTDPRDREQNDPALLSAINRDFDVAFVADEDFDFALSVPYHLVRPRPVIGSIDLEPVAWHWTWGHNGAPQVNTRFEKKSGGRHMEGADWAAWVAVKMIVQSVLRTRSIDFSKQRAFILGDASFDGDKGLAVSVRPWDHQVRQAVLLAAPYEVVADAPIEGFLHQSNELDTLGDDKPESPCHLDK
ncbi:MAG TPA: amino acid ABC transporter substrate-binding protein [Xanthobacteraceae bacterium]|nr:amino acid ABC transporter substrate-binding protein [Xanthobacteraceae bacterium]